MKNLTYLPRLELPALRSLLKHSKQFDLAVQEQIIAMQLQHRTGYQLVVSKEVTDLLEETDLPTQLRLDEIPWVQNALEVYFEDPALPTVLLSYLPPRRAWAILGLRPEDMAFPREKPEEAQLFGCVVAGEGLWSVLSNQDTFARHILNQDPIKHFLTTIGSDQAQPTGSPINVAMQRVIKVMFYAASDQAVRVVASRKQLHHGGKAGIKGRPDRPVTRIICLPVLQQHLEDNRRVQQVAQGTDRAAHPRRGFFRHYRAEKFTRMRGKIQFIPPTWVSGTEGLGKPTYLVRTPKTL